MDRRQTPDHFFARRYYGLPTSNMAYFPSSCDEELVDEADEPPDLSFLFSQSYHPTSISDGEFAKHSIRNSAPTESLLTKALANPSLHPGISFERTSTRPHRSPSTSSTWSASSAASTVDLISDGITSPSRANTPSPPHPALFHGLPSILQKPKIAFAVPHPDRSHFAKQEVEPQTRRPCITFACVGRQSPAAADQQQVKTQGPEAEHTPVPPKKSALTFACDLPAKPREDSRPTSPAKEKTAAPVDIRGREPEEDKYSREPKRFDDAEGAEDSWTNQPIDHSKLLRVDDVLKKERDIRKLSEEAEREAKLENGEDDDEEDEEQDDNDGAEVDDEDEDDDEDDDDDDNDDGYDRDSEDSDNDDDDYDSDDERIGGLSGNETDNEAGFASDSDSDDDLLFFGPHPPFAPTHPSRPPCCRRPPPPPASPPRRPSPPAELPDSTDFVCGTLDEDRALEDAFLSALETRKAKKAKRKPTPQDIDPSFPDSDPGSDSDAAAADRTPRFHSPPPRHASPRASPPARARSLPRTAACARRAMKTNTKPVLIKRGAADIVKGLEKRRERRKAKRGELRVGEGAERMRELAMELCGKGRARGALWVISA